jgi:hypothetical protein
MPIPEYSVRPADLSVIGKIEARVLHESWCRPPTRVLMYNNFDLTSSTVLLFFFSSNMKSAAVVVKLSRNVDLIKREYDNLCVLQSRVPGLAPVPLFFEKIDCFAAMAMQAVAGNRISGWDEQVAQLPALVDRLIDFHRRVAEEDFAPEQLGDGLFKPFAEIAALRRDPAITHPYERICADLAHTLQNRVLPRIPQHSDFYFHNTLICGDRIMIVDWEDFGQVHVPGYDLFCLFLNFYAPEDAKQVETFFRDRRLMQGMRNAMQSYFKAFDLSLDIAPGILAFTLVQQYLHSLHQGRSCAEMLWQRVASYVKHAERFAHLLAWS